MIDVNELKKSMYDVIGAIYEVHSELGPGLNESCYQEGLQLEFLEKKIPFKREMSFHPLYHGNSMEALFRLDFLCKDDIIIECKSVPEHVKVDRKQSFYNMRLISKTRANIATVKTPTVDYER